MGEKKISLGSLIDVELTYEELVKHIKYYAEAIKAAQPKTSGSILLQANNCRKKNCQSCPHFVWKIWKGNNGRWSAYSIKEPLRQAKRKDFPPKAREAIQAAIRLLRARALLTQQMAIVRRSAAAAQRQLDAVNEAHGQTLNEILTGHIDQ